MGHCRLKLTSNNWNQASVVHTSEQCTAKVPHKPQNELVEWVTMPSKPSV